MVKYPHEVWCGDFGGGVSRTLRFCGTHGGAPDDATGYSEMTDHRILSADRTVQESRFSDSTAVVVNFGDEPFTLPGGETLPARSHRVRLGR